MSCKSVPMEMLKGESAYLWQVSQSGYEVAILQSDSQANRWSSTENNSSNAWNVNFGSVQQQQQQEQRVWCAACRRL